MGVERLFLDEDVDAIGWHVFDVGLAESAHIHTRAPDSFLHKVGSYRKRSKERTPACLTGRPAAVCCVTHQLDADIVILLHTFHEPIEGV